MFVQLGTQPTGLHPHHGIQLGVKVCLPAENFCGDLIFLEWYAGMVQGVVREVAQQLTKGFRAMQHLPADQTIDFRQNLVLRHPRPVTAV